MLRPLHRYLLATIVGAVTSGCSGGGNALSALPSSGVNQTSSVAVAQGLSAPQALTRNVLSQATASPSGSGLSDDFSKDAVGGSATGWSVSTGTWSVCKVGTVHAYCQTSKPVSESFNGSQSWTDYMFQAQVVDTNVNYGAVGVLGRATGPDQYYGFQVQQQTGGTLQYWYLYKRDGSKDTTLASGPLSAPDKNPSYGLRIAFRGTTITGSIAFDGGTDYKVVTTVNDSSYSAGQVGLRTSTTTTSQISSVLATLATPLPTETAVSSSSFVDSIGENAHFSEPTYSQTNVRALTANLGIRHYRVSASDIVAGGSYLANLTDLYQSYGTKFDVLTNLFMPATQVVQVVELLPAGSVDSVEGPNESNNSSQGKYYDPNFAVDVPVYMQSLYSAIKGTAATSQIAVVAASFTTPAAYAAVGNISGSTDYGNMHDYFPGFNPGTVGWGGSGYSFAPTLHYGSIDWNIASAGQATAPKPIMATETGYCNAPIHSCVPLDIQATYVPRLYLEQYRHNVSRTYMYELVEDNTSTGVGSYGIVNPSDVPTPAYNALEGLISLLNDGRATSSPRTYNWSLTGATANVDHVLMHKADGTFVLPLWIEVPSFDPNANGGLGSVIAVAPQAVTVNLEQTSGTGAVWSYSSETGLWSSQPVTVTNGTVSLNVTDSVSVLEVKPS